MTFEKAFDDSRTERKSKKHLFAPERIVEDINECEFYHSVELPGHGLKGVGWDLRACADSYLGVPKVQYKNKTVLELGTANGFLCNHMEKMGADVIAYDLHPNLEWDIVPFAQYDYKATIKDQQKIVERINNAWWYSKRAFNWKANVVYGSVYEVPFELGPVDITTFGSILLHLRDPFRALHRASLMTKEFLVITDMVPYRKLTYSPSFLRRGKEMVKKFVLGQAVDFNRDVPYLEFLPDFKTVQHRAAWWYLSPDVIKAMVGVLGFEDTQVSYIDVDIPGSEKKSPFYTVVAKRTRPF